MSGETHHGVGQVNNFGQYFPIRSDCNLWRKHSFSLFKLDKILGEMFPSGNTVRAVFRLSESEKNLISF